jgi:hypothetical protein
LSFKLLLAGVALACFAVPAFAQFNKCTGSDGRIVYTDGPCPSGAKSDPRFSPNEPVPVRELNSHEQVLARWCVERWRDEASPQGRAALAASLHQQAQQGGEAVRERVRKAGMTLEQAVNAQIDREFVQSFNTDCLSYGFKRIDPSTDQYNERMSASLEQALDTRYPGSKQAFERAKGR